MKKILIVGPAGAGKSTFAKELGDKLEIDVYHLDKYYWLPNWTNPNIEDWENKLDDLMKNDAWILDGNYYKTLDKRLKQCDTVIYLKINRFICVSSILKRVKFTKKNKLVRDDLAEGCIDKAEFSLLKWSFSYNKKYAPTIEGIIKKYPYIKVITFKTRKEAYKFLEGLNNEESHNL